jgi:hypothetical protein
MRINHTRVLTVGVLLWSQGILATGRGRRRYNGVEEKKKVRREKHSPLLDITNDRDC